MGLVDFLLRPIACVRVLCRPTSQRLLVDPSILSVLQAVLGAGMTLVKVRLCGPDPLFELAPTLLPGFRRS